MVSGKFMLALACSFAAAVVIPSALAGDKGIKQHFLANTTGDCFQGATSGTKLKGFVVLKEADGNVQAKIRLRGAPQNGVWEIEVDQRPLEGCVLDSDFITTDGHGNGNAQHSEPILAGNTGAFVRLIPLNAAAVAGGIIATKGTDF